MTLGERTSIQLVTSPFEPGLLLASFCKDRIETGAIVSFTGLMRADLGSASALELDAYPGFTELAITQIVNAAAERFDLQDVSVVHRIGAIAPGEPIVFVAVASGHRRGAFEGADFLMDYLKSRAPFWKKSIGPDGDRWIEPTGQDYKDAARWDETSFQKDG